MKILLTVSCMQPDVIPIWKTTWDVLKKNHPSIKVNVFAVPMWKGDFQKDIFKNTYFKDWFRERKHWIEIGQQGHTNSYPPECTRFKKPQYIMIKQGYRKVGTYMPKDYYCFNPPYDRMDDKITPKILENLGFTACLWNKNIIMLKKCNKPLPEDYEIIRTKIDIEERNPDDIQIIFDKLDKSLFDFETKGCEFVTFRDLFKECFLKEEVRV